MGIFKKKVIDVPRRRQSSGFDDSNTGQVGSDSFRRGRTIVGSITSIQSNNVNNKSDSSRSFDSPRTHIHHLSIKRRKLSGLLMISALAVTFLWLIVSNFTASLIVRTSNLDIVKPINEKAYISTINSYLEANPLNRLSFLLDSKALTSYVSATHPEVIDVHRQGNSIKPGETDFIISFRNPVAGWRIQNSQFYVDSKGVSFEENYFANPSVQIVDESGISPQTGVAMASKRFLSFVGRVVALARGNSYEITKAVLPKNTTRELDVYFKGTEYYAKLSVDRGAGEQVEDISTAIKYFATHSVSPKYIDVRVSGKAFYRL